VCACPGTLTILRRMITDRRSIGAVSLSVLLTAFASGRVLANTLVPLRPQPPGVEWPDKDWPTGPLPASVSAAALEKVLSFTAAEQPALGQTRAVVIIQGGKLVAERYMPGFGANTPLISWSMAKSFTQAMLGVAVRKGLVDIDK